MPPQQFTTDDHRYLMADQGDGNLVVYDRGVAVWDRWSYEARTNTGDNAPPPPTPPVVLPDPATGPLIVDGALSLIPITAPEDGPFVNRGYSYWAQAWRQGPMVYCFAGHADGHPRFYAISIPGPVVEPLGEALDAFNYVGTGEGCYWDLAGNLYLIRGAALHRVNIFTGSDEIVMDVGRAFSGCDLWQAHSSDDGLVHSATVRKVVQDGAYPQLGTAVQRQGAPLQFFSADTYRLDESQVSSDGGYVLIKSTPDDDNLLINLRTGEKSWLSMRMGALGHSDCGDSCAVGADRAIGALTLIDFRQPFQSGRPLYQSWNVGHVALRGPLCIVTDEEAIYQVRLDGTGLNRLVNHGQQGDTSLYDNQVKANLSPDGSVVCFMANNLLNLLVLR